MIDVERFGEIDGQHVHRFRLTGNSGAVVDLLNYGVTVADWRVPAPEGLRSIVLGFDSLEAYQQQTAFIGSIQGRVANRIGGAHFTLDGQVHHLTANDGANMLHGGAGGLGRQVWTAEADTTANAVRFTHVSPHGAMGFPGEVIFTATYRLAGDTLSLALHGFPDRPTPISLCQHLYFNLGTGPDVAGHMLQIDAARYTEAGPELIPTGRILNVAGTRFDFREARRLGDTPLDYDLNFALRPSRNLKGPVAKLAAPDGLTLSLVTDRPGLQFYTGQHLGVPFAGHGGRLYSANAGLCLEDQGFPDAVNHPNFPSVICSPDRPYAHHCAITVSS